MGKLPTAVGGLTRDIEYGPWGQAGLEETSAAAGRELWHRHRECGGTASRLQQHQVPTARNEGACWTTAPQQPEASRGRYCQGQAGSALGDLLVVKIVTQSRHRPVELLRAVLSVRRDHEAVAQEGTQVPVQSSIFLAPKQKVKALVREGDAPHPRGCCPAVPPSSSPTAHSRVIKGKWPPILLPRLAQAFLLHSSLPLTLGHRVKGWKRPKD